jgi:hypothetical protein
MALWVYQLMNSMVMGGGGYSMGYRCYFHLYETTFLSCKYSSFLLFECDVEDLMDSIRRS